MARSSFHKHLTLLRRALRSEVRMRCRMARYHDDPCTEPDLRLRGTDKQVLDRVNIKSAEWFHYH